LTIFTSCGSSCPDERIIEEDDPLAFQDAANGVQLHHAEVTDGLLR
jgi:hypothetical protein